MIESESAFASVAEGAPLVVDRTETGEVSSLVTTLEEVAGTSATEAFGSVSGESVLAETCTGTGGSSTTSAGITFTSSTGRFALLSASQMSHFQCSRWVRP